MSIFLPCCLSLSYLNYPLFSSFSSVSDHSESVWLNNQNLFCMALSLYSLFRVTLGYLKQLKLHSPLITTNKYSFQRWFLESTREEHVSKNCSQYNDDIRNKLKHWLAIPMTYFYNIFVRRELLQNNELSSKKYSIIYAL